MISWRVNIIPLSNQALNSMNLIQMLIARNKMFSVLSFLQPLLSKKKRKKEGFRKMSHDLLLDCAKKNKCILPFPTAVFECTSLLAMRPCPWWAFHLSDCVEELWPISFPVAVLFVSLASAEKCRSFLFWAKRVQDGEENVDTGDGMISGYRQIAPLQSLAGQGHL